MIKEDLTITDFEKQIILLTKGWFDRVSDESTLDKLKTMISVHCKIDRKYYINDYSAIYHFVSQIIPKLNLSASRCLDEIYDGMKHKLFNGKGDYNCDDLVESLFSIISNLRVSQIPCELGEPDFHYFHIKCTVCGKECYNDKSPEIVFWDYRHCICENCSIDFEEVNGKVQYRSDLISRISVIDEEIVFKCIKDYFSEFDDGIDFYKGKLYIGERFGQRGVYRKGYYIDSTENGDRIFIKNDEVKDYFEIIG